GEVGGKQLQQQQQQEDDGNRYTSVPAFARDMNLVFSNVRRVWPPGAPGSCDNPRARAAEALRLAFDARWRELAPRLHEIQRGALERVREEVKSRAEAQAAEAQAAADAG
ncbi:unnamed protein product, partial [Discosporangium mesarthrocarpum]